MTKWPGWVTLALAFGLIAAGVAADDLGDADRWLCAPHSATRCFPDGECLTAPPAEWNIPAFIIIDLAEKKLSTTPASGENRSTAITHVVREAGMIFIQGVEGGRAFSFAVEVSTGTTTFSVATAGTAVGGFGACTVLPVDGR